MDFISEKITDILAIFWDVENILKVLAVIVLIALLGIIASTVYYHISSRAGNLDPDSIRNKYGISKEKTEDWWYKKNLEYNTIYLTSLAGISLIIVTQLLQVPTLDIPLTICLYAFAFAIPILAGEIILQRQSSLSKYTALWDITKLSGAGLYVGYAGMVSLFYHFSFVAATIFAIATGLTWGSLSKWLEIKKVVNEESENGTMQHTGTRSKHKQDN